MTCEEVELTGKHGQCAECIVKSAPRYNCCFCGEPLPNQYQGPL